MRTRPHHLLSCLIITHACTVMAHPVSHTDGWLTVADDIEVRLNIFLHDVLGPTAVGGDQLATISAQDAIDAIGNHADFLLNSLQLYANGRRLCGEVTAEPRWQPSDDVVNLESEGDLRLSWKLRFSLAQQDLQRLTIVHGFVGTDPAKPGELRLQIRTRSGRRRSAIIPPNRPHTIQLDSSANVSEANDPFNQVQSRIVITAGSIVHELTAPLYQLSGEWPRIASTPSEGSLEGPLSDVSAEAVIATLEDRIATRLVLRVAGGESLTSQDTTVHLFDSGIPDVSEAEAATSGGASVKPRRVPLMGTVVGIRQVFDRPAASDSFELNVDSSLGDFSSLRLIIVTAAGEQSSLIAPDRDSGAEPSFFCVGFSVPSRQTPTVDAVSAISQPENLIVSTRQFHQVGILAAIFVFLSGIVRVVRTSGGSGRVRQGAVLVFIAVLIVSLSLQTHYAARIVPVRELVSQLLTAVYSVANISERDIAINRLSEALHDDVLEKTFLELSDVLSDTGEGVMVAVDTVDLNSVERVYAKSPGLLSLTADWTVGGTVYHWGHVHQRFQRCRANLQLARISGRWKIRRVQLVDVSTKLSSRSQRVRFL